MNNSVIDDQEGFSSIKELRRTSEKYNIQLKTNEYFSDTTIAESSIKAFEVEYHRVGGRVRDLSISSSSEDLISEQHFYYTDVPLNSPHKVENISLVNDQLIATPWTLEQNIYKVSDSEIKENDGENVTKKKHKSRYTKIFKGKSSKTKCPENSGKKTFVDKKDTKQKKLKTKDKTVKNELVNDIFFPKCEFLVNNSINQTSVIHFKPDKAVTNLKDYKIEKPFECFYRINDDKPVHQQFQSPKCNRTSEMVNYAQKLNNKKTSFFSNKFFKNKTGFNEVGNHSNKCTPSCLKSNKKLRDFKNSYFEPFYPSNSKLSTEGNQIAYKQSYYTPQNWTTTKKGGNFRTSDNYVQNNEYIRKEYQGNNLDFNRNFIQSINNKDNYDSRWNYGNSDIRQGNKCFKERSILKKPSNFNTKEIRFKKEPYLSSTYFQDMREKSERNRDEIRQFPDQNYKKENLYQQHFYNECLKQQNMNFAPCVIPQNTAKLHKQSFFESPWCPTGISSTTYIAPSSVYDMQPQCTSKPIAEKKTKDATDAIDVNNNPKKISKKRSKSKNKQDSNPAVICQKETKELAGKSSSKKSKAVKMISHLLLHRNSSSLGRLMTVINKKDKTNKPNKNLEKKMKKKGRTVYIMVRKKNEDEKCKE